MNALSAVCPRCHYYQHCKRPCGPVERHLQHENMSVWEKSAVNQHGELITIAFSKSREQPFSKIPQQEHKEGHPATTGLQQMAFSTENESAFASFQPALKRTGLFIDRFFNKLSFDDLAVKYEITSRSARKLYGDACKRLFDVLNALDKPNLDYWREKTEARTGHMPKGQRWFLLNKIFGMSAKEIARMDKVKRPQMVNQLMIRVSDQLKAGEITLIEYSPEEQAEAKARLDALRAKRREQHAKKRKA